MAWFVEVDVAAVARGFGCPARRIETHDELSRALDEVVRRCRSREEPLVLDVRIEPTMHFAP